MKAADFLAAFDLPAAAGGTPALPGCPALRDAGNPYVLRALVASIGACTRLADQSSRGFSRQRMPSSATAKMRVRATNGPHTSSSPAPRATIWRSAI